MPNFDFVTDRLATGGDLHWREDLAAADLAAVVQAGITHVIDCRQEWSDEAFVADHAPHIAYLHAGVDDAGGRQPDWFFDRAVSFALAALAEPGTRVLTHCHMGINRGPSLALAVLLALDWDVVAAMDGIRGARPIAAIGYAEDALDWHHRRTGAPELARARDRRRLRGWRAADTLDVAATIRGIRAAEGTELRRPGRRREGLAFTPQRTATPGRHRGREQENGMKRRVRFVTGGEPLAFTVRQERRSASADWPTESLRALRRRRRAARPVGGTGVGYWYRLATAEERRDWPVLDAEQCFWVASCDHCDGWAYGRKKRDVMEWGTAHVAEVHPGPDPTAPAATSGTGR